MNLAAILALLLNSGVCAKTDFHGGSGATLSVIVCPVMAGPQAPQDNPPPAPPEPKSEAPQA